MRRDITPAQCNQTLASYCVPDPPQWKQYTMNQIPGGGKGLTTANLTDYTAEFLLTRGPYAMLGYTWYGCTGSAFADYHQGGASYHPPRAKEWDMDFGAPMKPCVKRVGQGLVYTRDYEKATVEWDCDKGHGMITMKHGPSPSPKPPNPPAPSPEPPQPSPSPGPKPIPPAPAPPPPGQCSVPVSNVDLAVHTDPVVGETDTAQACASMCTGNHTATPGCYGYTWNDLSQGRWSRRCYFINHANPWSKAHAKEGTISGICN